MESLNPPDAALMLFEQHGDELYRFIRYTVGRKSDADDLLQETFLRVLQSWANFRHKSSPKTWLWSIAKNCIRDFYRSQRRHSRDVSLPDDIGQRTTADEELVNAQLQRNLQQLTVSQRQVFIERIIHDKTTAETALTLNWSESKVKTTLHRALRALRNSFWKGVDESV